MFNGMRKASTVANLLCGILLVLCFVYAPWSVERKDYKGHVEQAKFKTAAIWTVPELESRETAQLAFGLMTVRLLVIGGIWFFLGKAVNSGLFNFRVPKIESPAISVKTLQILLTGLLLALLLIITGCATQYGKQGFTGGYKETQLAPDVWRVTMQGNAYVSAERMSDYALLRASELCLESGYQYFAIVDEKDASKMMAWNSGSTATVRGRNIFFGPSMTSMIAKPGSSIIVKGFKEKPAGDMAFDAAFLDKSLRNRYKLKAKK